MTNNNYGGNNNGGKNNSHYSCMAFGTIKGRLADDPKVEYDEKNKATKVSARVLVNKKDGSVDSWNIVEYKNDNAEYASANFRALAEFLKKGRPVTITGEIAQNSRNNNGQYTYFLQIKPVPGGIVMDNDGSQSANNNGGNNYNNQSQNQGNFGAQNQGNFANQSQGGFNGQNFGGQNQPQNQGAFNGQNPNQGNFGGGNFGGGNFGGGNFGGGNFGGQNGPMVGAGAPAGSPGQNGPGNFGR